MSYMFNSFYNIPRCYIPDNMHPRCRPSGLKRLTGKNLDAILDSKGKFKGYSWNYGETVEIPLTVNFPITIENDAIYTYDPSEVPGHLTPGKIGQKFYNLASVESYFLKSYVPSEKWFIWEKEPVFTYPENGHMIIDVKPDMKGKYILAEFLNFRGEQMFECVFDEVNSASIDIDIPKSLAIPRGIYSLTVYVGTSLPEDEEEYKKVKQYKHKSEEYEIVVR